MSLLMQKLGYSSGKIIPLFLILLLTVLVLLTEECRRSRSDDNKYRTRSVETKSMVSDGYTVNVRFRSFQNSDSTWGYTIFLNSKPYMHFSGSPVKKTDIVFRSKEEAEAVAGILVKKIQNGEMAPRIDKKQLDSVEQKLEMKE
jgi:hypothetical protein